MIIAKKIFLIVLILFVLATISYYGWDEKKLDSPKKKNKIVVVKSERELTVFSNGESLIEWCSPPPISWVLDYEQPQTGPWGAYIYSYFNKGYVFESVSVDKINYYFISYAISHHKDKAGFKYSKQSGLKFYKIVGYYSDKNVFKNLESALSTKYGIATVDSTKDHMILNWNDNREDREMRFNYIDNSGYVSYTYKPIRKLLDEESRIMRLKNFNTDEKIKKILDLASEYEECCSN